MKLEDTYDHVLPCLVAFILKKVFVQNIDAGPPIFPPILGTGFFVHKSGIVATNRHVVEAFPDYVHPETAKTLVAGLLFIPGVNTENGQSYIQLSMVDLHRSTIVSSVSGINYGEDVPDIGFVQLKVQAVPALELSTEPYFVRPGMSIATAGFPLGEQSMTPFGKASQATPFLRRGIVSSVFPFSIESPHGFSIDILQQGGSSGSPIFRCDGPSVVGMMSSSAQDFSTTPPQNTNISYCVPSTAIKGALKLFESTYGFNLDGIPTLKEHLEAAQTSSFGFAWEATPE